ncbi:hypothetical protein QVD17_31114 [Tagetes erecta]|uniref:3-ketoacyl-CoA synthase n=1 Tax=Tagetes erecta TaxID=13708 RepID=A0AAD8K3Z7_TARER|nr:hypothetical protein QVD17_31114 [Tagetes erecta]
MELALTMIFTQLNANDTINLYAIIITCTALIVGFFIHRMTSQSKPVYLVDYSCYRPPDHLKLTSQMFMHRSKLSQSFTDSSLHFQRLILTRSGLGEETYLPPALHVMPYVPSIISARNEAEDVIFGALDNLFISTNLHTKDIGILVVNCCIFNPVPSLSSMIVNKYKLRENIRSFNLSGMGCSAGVIAVDLAKHMLKVHPNTYALVVSTENVTGNWYVGNQKSMLIPNCLFREGGAALLLSNKADDKHRSKYKLLHVVRTHYGANNTAFNCAYQQEDDSGNIGVVLSKDLVTVASEALKVNIATLGPLVSSKNLKKVFDHLCIHAGGRAVIDEMEKSLQLTKEDVEASRMTLNRFGNTSSSSIWYELAYTEAKGRMKKGHRVWQIGIGSGFKFNSAVWEAVGNVDPSAHNPWIDCVRSNRKVQV